MSGNTTDPGDRSSAEIEREVEGTRAQLNETLGALRDSASPGQLMDKAVDYLRGSGGADFTRNLGEAVRDKLVYYPTVTREKFENNGRLTDLLRIGKLAADVGLPPIEPESDRFMICGSPSMLKEICAYLDSRGFTEARHGEAAHYVIERAFVES